MKRLLKIIGWFLLSVVVLVVAAAFIIPAFFKDDIKAAIDEQLEKNVNATVFFDVDKFGLSLFSNFPNITVTMDDFGVVGKEDFDGDTLASIPSFKIELDLMSVISGDTMKINGLYIEDATINALVNKEGKANWDIAVPSEEQEETEESAPFSMKIDHWSILNTDVVYHDQPGKMLAVIKKLNHTGSGEIAELYELSTSTTIEELTYAMDGVEYLYKNKFASDFDVLIDLDKMLIKMGENFIKLNEFALMFGGDVEIGDEAIKTNITFEAKETEFRNILSLVPGIFLEGFEELKTSGSLAFKGKVTEELTDDRIPNLDISMQIKDGMFQYPDLPTAVKNVQMDLAVINEDGVLDNTKLELKEFHMDMGSNPVDIKLLLQGFVEMEQLKVISDIKARVNLADIVKIYPIDGLDLKGTYGINLNAKGVYSEAANLMPTISGTMGMKDGYVKSSEFPEPIENIHFNSSFLSDGTLPNTEFNLETLAFSMQDEEFVASADVRNFDNIIYEAALKGTLDLDKIMQIFPMDDMELGGKIVINDFETRGDMLDLEAENYEALYSAGSAEIKDFKFVSEDVPMGFMISNSVVSFDPENINIESFQGQMGNSDMTIDGKLGNYMGYLFSDTDSIIHGKMNMTCEVFDVDEWMVEPEGSEVAEPAEGEEEDLEIVPVPQNIDFTLNADIKKVVYDGIDPTNLKGIVLIQNGAVKMQDVSMSMLGADFLMSGAYDTYHPEKPFVKYDMDFQGMSIAKAYEYMGFVQALAPAADKFEGTFSSVMSFESELEDDYMPKMGTMSLDGLVHIHEAIAKAGDVKFLKKLTDFAKVKDNGGDAKKISLNDEKMDVVVADGMLWVKPFKLKAGDVDMEMQINRSITDMAINHLVGLDVPAGGLATGASALGLAPDALGDKIHLDLGVKGTTAKPKIKLLGTSTSGGGAKDLAKQKLDEEMEKQKQKAQEELDKRKQQLQDEADEQKKKMQEELDKKKKEAEDKAKEELKDQVKDNVKDNVKDKFKKLPKW